MRRSDFFRKLGAGALVSGIAMPLWAATGSSHPDHVAFVENRWKKEASYDKFKKKFVLLFLFITSILCLQAHASGTKDGWLGEVKGGVRIQKAQKLYWENGFALDFTSSKIADRRIHLGVNYVTTRLGSAIGSNAIKQDNFLISTGYYFRHQKQLQPFTCLNIGYFHADYEYAIFDILPNKAFLFSIDAGLSYEFNAPFSISLSAGYNLDTGTGSVGPGTLYPVFYQMSIYYTLLKKK
ncbi:MAG TPA: hypothetical protein VIK10_09940 [Prolixibacteraceae bacterium]